MDTPAVKAIPLELVPGDIVNSRTVNKIDYQGLIDALSTTRVVFVGETHTNPEHHEIQLKIIESLAQSLKQSGRTVSIGMEMFDHTYQNVLDEWSAGELDEKTFLARAHWYANWRYPYKLYRGILDFSKENKVKVFGLNIPFHIPKKISTGGVDSLNDYEKRLLPQHIDLEIKPHRDYVSEVFKQHSKMGRSFEYFYQAQCVWEEIMAESIAMNLDTKTNPGIMIVIVGNGHIINGFGVPDRMFKRTKADFATVYTSLVDSDPKPEWADYIWITSRPAKKPMGAR